MDDHNFILSHEILGKVKNDHILNKGCSNDIYNFEYFICHFFHPFHLFGVSGI